MQDLEVRNSGVSWLGLGLPGGRLDSPAAVRMLNPLVLAYVGDTVFDLYVRTCLVCHHDATAHTLNCMAVERVRAEGQRASLDRLSGRLTPEEEEILRRGRNAKSPTAPKHAALADYRAATGLEALIGDLYLCGRWERLGEILRLAADPAEL